MTIRLSTGLRNALAGATGLQGALNKCSIQIYSGAQPINADAAATGTLLGTVTLGSGVLTPETQASGTITVTGGSTSILTVTVGGLNIIPDGAVAYNSTVAQTASDLCDAINRNGLFTASVSGAVVTLKPRPGAGATYNAVAIATTGSVTTSVVAFSGGISPANALTFAQNAAGVAAKPSTAVWSFNGIATGTAGWFRIVASTADAGAAVSAAPWLLRLDGSIASSGGDMALSNLSITSGAPSTIDACTITMPAQ